MIAEWMVYCVGTSALLALSALTLERGFRLRGAPIRWVWVGALLGSLSLAALPWISARWSGGATTREVVAAEGPRSTAAGQWMVTSFESPPPARTVFPALARLDTPLLLLWALLSASGLAFLLVTHGKLARRRRRWRPTTVDGVPVLVSRDVGPAVIGFLDAAIVVPEWVMGMDAAKRRLVLSHEEEHLRARDAGLLALALASVALMPWNAALWWQARRLRHAVEMDCDARVVQRCADVRGYSALLIEVGERISSPTVAFAAFSESTSFLERRIRTMITLRSRRWKLALGGSIAAGVGLLVLACEAPRPTMPSGTTGPTAEPAPQLPQEDEVADSPQAPQPRPDTFKFERAANPPDPLVANGREMRQLVQRLAPDIDANGLPLDQALWIAVDASGRFRKTWVGPNLYINVWGGAHPNRAIDYPRGSVEARRAAADRERDQDEEIRANVPGMHVRGGFISLVYGIGPHGTILHFVTEAPGIPNKAEFPFAGRVVGEAIRAELQRPTAESE